MAASAAPSLLPDRQLLPGEVVQGKDDNITYLPLSEFQDPVPGVLSVTNYRVQFHPSSAGSSAAVIEFPLTTIETLERISPQTSKSAPGYGVRFQLKDFRSFSFASPTDSPARATLLTKIQSLAFCEAVGKASAEEFLRRLFAFEHFRCRSDVPTRTLHGERGWRLYSAEREFTRQGLDLKKWRFSVKNAEYKLCDTYPALIVVPAEITDDELELVAAFRSRKRLPVLSWFNSKNHAAIVRCAQPCTGALAKRSAEDQKMLAAVRKGATAADMLYIYDARPQRNAVANTAQGFGYESEAAYEPCKLTFLNIHNIHVVRESMLRLRDLCAANIDDQKWLTNLENTQWLKHIRSILLGAQAMARLVANGSPIVTHCSDGWDRTAQLTSLAMLILDPYYRTITGFLVLIEKEWLCFGHKFHQRLGTFDANYKDSQRSPIFLQFIDCVWQMLQQHPCEFEFGEPLLLEILDHLYSCCYGTFLCDSERLRAETGVRDGTLSLWAAIEEHRARFVSPIYDRQLDIMYINCNMRHLAFWTGYYIRWNPQLSAQEAIYDRSAKLLDICHKLEARMRAEGK